MGHGKLTSNSLVDEYQRFENFLDILKMLVIFAFFPKIRTWEPGPVLGNLDLNKSLIGDLYSGTRTRTRNLTHTRLWTQISKYRRQ